ISDFRRIFCFYVSLFFSAVRPDFIALNLFALEILHRHIEQLYAAFTSKNKEPHDGVTVQTRDSLRAANASALNQELNRKQGFIFRHRHCAEQPFMPLGVRLSTLPTAKTLKPVPVLPEL